ncbi:MAG TPA: hypothetical protein VHB21_15540, partial [Minicystis sp.]|nr:hypothetical protein [Minicystis sp.]
EPHDAGAALEKALGRGFRGDLTVADAAAKSGLALRDAEAGLFHLVSRYRGHLRATDKGELVYRFPDGFSRAWERKTKLDLALARVGRFAAGALRFVVRAWIAIVLLGYTAIFLAVMLGLVFAGGSSGGRDRRSVNFSFAPFFFRVIFDALFWTFHPFSPVAWGYGYGYGAYGYGYERAPRRRARDDEKKEPFYERVNRYFFGPSPPPKDPRAIERAVVQEIRAKKGRIGLADVLRVTGLPRDEADPLIARLMLDYDGDVDVSEDGGIVYRFPSLRITTDTAHAEPPAPPVWDKREQLPPLTGNDFGSNALITGLNAFNIVMALVAFEQDLTLSRLVWLFRGVPLFRVPFDGTPIALGVVPLVFSIALFGLPLGRAVVRRLRAGSVARENGRRALLRTILTSLHGERELSEGLLRASYEAGAGKPPDEKLLRREVLALGGELELLDDGKTRFRFPDLEAEAKAVEAEREAAAEEEARVGQVVFSSDA